MLRIAALFLCSLNTIFAFEVVGLGAAITDHLVQVDETVLENEQFEKGGWYQISNERLQGLLQKHETETKPGGSTVNVLKGLTQLGYSTHVFGRTGNDAAADVFDAQLKECGVTSHLSRGEIASGQLISYVTQDGQRTFAVYFGASQSNTPPLEIKQELFENAKHLHIEGYQFIDYEAMKKAAALAKERGMTISLDLANQFVIKKYREELEEFLPLVDILIGNQDEARELTGFGPFEAVDRLARGRKAAVVTMSEKGAVARSGETKAYAPSCGAQVLDTTGAGDYFAAGFLSQFFKGAPLQTCVNEGCYIASHVIQNLGCEITKAQWETIKSRDGKKSSPQESFCSRYLGTKEAAAGQPGE